MGLKVSRCLPSFLLVLFAAQFSVNAQSVPCAAITRNPLVLEALLDSHSNDSEPDLRDGTINAAQLEHLQFSPIVIQPGDALYIEYRGRDFTVNAGFANGDRTEFDSSPKGSYEQWRKGILPLDMFRAALNQRLIRLRATTKSPNQIFFRNIKIVRAGRPVFEFASLASYGKPQVKTAVERQLPCVAFDDVPANGTSRAVNYSVANPEPVRDFSGGLAQPMLPPFPMMMQSTTTGTDANHYKFTGKEFDDETGLYNYGARYYGPALGRFITPDWSAVPVPVPYADLTDPQSLNQYSYVRNIPTVHADADGHCPDGGCTDYLTAQQSTDSMKFLGGELIGVGKAIINAIPKTYNAAAGFINTQIEADPQMHDVPLMPSAPTLPVNGPAEAVGNGVGELGIIAAGGAKGNSSTAAGESEAAAGEVPTSIPAGPGARPSPSQQSAINQMGDAHGCSTCGTTTPGTKSGNWVGDHQPPTALNKNGGPQVYKPQCLQCSRQQGGQVSAAVKAAKKQPQTQ